MIKILIISIKIWTFAKTYDIIYVNNTTEVCIMLKGHFENCYGLENFDLLPISFSTENNKAMIYAPNGVMKSSLASVFDNLSRKKKTRIEYFLKTNQNFQYNTMMTHIAKKQRKLFPLCMS